MTEPKLTVRRAAIDSLKPDPENVRLHSDRNIAAIQASLEAFGQQKPIVVRSDGTVVAGNGTLEAAKALGWKEIEVVETDLEGSALRAFAIADNRTAELASWDVGALCLAIDALGGVLGATTGFTADELAAIQFKDEAKAGGSIYTTKVGTPIYAPKGKLPKFSEMVNRTKVTELIAEIDGAGLPEETAAFLRIAAERHAVFSFSRVAEFYSQADEKTQRLMERSGLVIVDWDAAIESGFVKITKTMGLLADSDRIAAKAEESDDDA